MRSFTVVKRVKSVVLQIVHEAGIARQRVNGILATGAATGCSAEAVVISDAWSAGETGIDQAMIGRFGHRRLRSRKRKRVAGDHRRCEGQEGIVAGDNQVLRVLPSAHLRSAR